MAALGSGDLVSKLPLWNNGSAETTGEFATLSQPFSDPKPGKLAYALDYKASLRAESR